jgi:hypothetical protein
VVAGEGLGIAAGVGGRDGEGGFGGGIIRIVSEVEGVGGVLFCMGLAMLYGR